MRKRLQLTVTTPCGEQWEGMQPEERGRHCAMCDKTVVDFTGFTDREMLVYLARAGQGVCGRFSAGQLEQRIELKQGRGGARWWRWLVAGLLFSAEVKAQRAPKAAVAQHIAKIPADTSISDSVRYKELPAVVVTGYGVTKCTTRMGAVAYSITATFADSLLKNVADTLSMLGVLPKKELTVYPNPVRRGMVATLSWDDVQAGEYEVGLFSTSGGLIARQVIVVSTGEQTSLFEIPASLAKGIYILRVARAGEVRVLSRKLVVL